MQQKRLLTLGGILLLVVALPGIILLSRSQQNFQQSAHTPTPSAKAVCQGSTVIVSSSYTIANVPNNATCQVTATDSQQYLNDAFSTKQGNPPHTKSADTQKSTISPGVITFKTNCSDGFKETDQASYSLTKPCISTTPTPSLTPKPSLTTTPTPSSCEANKSVCSWLASDNTVSYHYQVFDKNNTLVVEGDVQASQTSVSFPSVTGGSYTCKVKAVNACGTGQEGTGQFTCNITPTPSLCVTLPAPHVRVSCPNCNQ